jgi:hypothetical protein
MQAGYVDFVSEQEQAIELAKYLDKVRAVKAQQSGSEAPSTTLLSSCTQLVKDSKFLEVLANLLKESGDLFVAGAEKGPSSLFFCRTESFPFPHRQVRFSIFFQMWSHSSACLYLFWASWASIKFSNYRTTFFKRSPQISQTSPSFV